MTMVFLTCCHGFSSWSNWHDLAPSGCRGPPAVSIAFASHRRLAFASPEPPLGKRKCGKLRVLKVRFMNVLKCFCTLLCTRLNLLAYCWDVFGFSVVAAPYKQGEVRYNESSPVYTRNLPVFLQSTLCFASQISTESASFLHEQHTCVDGVAHKTTATEFRDQNKLPCLRQDPLIWVFGHFWRFCTMV